ncbi:MAG: hypothetical protein Q9170_000809 [Blastenia crenularia]
MEQVNRLRTSLFDGVAKEFNIFEHTLKAELARRDELHASKINGLREEIQSLQRQASRVTELENELHRIQVHRSETHRNITVDSLSTKDKEQSLNKKADDSHGEPSRQVPVEIYEEGQREFLECSSELQRVKEAFEFMKSEAKRWKKLYRMVQRPTPRQALNSSRQTLEKDARPNSAPRQQSSSHVGIVEPMVADTRSGLSPDGSSVFASFRQPQALPSLKAPPGLEFHGHNLERPNQSSLLIQARASEPPMNTRHGESSTESSDAPEQNVTPVDWQIKGRALAASSGAEDQLKAPKSDPDVPVVVSERLLKRKRKESPTKTWQRPKLIKVETLSSSPVAPNASIVGKRPQESLDLDEIPNPLYTPRKDQRNRHRMFFAPPTLPLTNDFPAKGQNNGLQVESRTRPIEKEGYETGALDEQSNSYDNDIGIRDEAYFQRTGEEYAAHLWARERRTREGERRTKPRLHNAREITKHRIIDKLKDNPSDSSRSDQTPTAQKHILQPTDANRVLPTTYNRLTNTEEAADPGGWHHSAHYVEYLAEDGENNQENGSLLNSNARQLGPQLRSDDPTATKLRNPQAQQRLDQLLAEPSPQKPPLGNKDVNTMSSKSLRDKASTESPFTYGKQTRQHVAHDNLSTGQGSPSMTKPGRTSSSSKTLTTPQTSAQYKTPFSKSTSSKVPQTHPHLRSRRLLDLTLDDFKINPKHNQGYSHPFKEVVRKKDQRKCLPGCTRLECCGKIFRQMAESGLFKPIHTTRFLASSQDDEDQTIMQDYLGDQAFRLRKMSEVEKAEVLLQAKTKILADHYGKHREVYAREPSPVGYWDVDMPNTQEAAEMGKVAEVRNRQKVEERYREAMRQDGIWKFRDE